MSSFAFSSSPSDRGSGEFSDGTNSAYFWDSTDERDRAVVEAANTTRSISNNSATVAKKPARVNRGGDESASEENPFVDDHNDKNWVPDNYQESKSKKKTLQNCTNMLASFPAVIALDEDDLLQRNHQVLPQTFYRQFGAEKDFTRNLLQEHYDNKQELEKKINDHIASKCATSVTRALLSRHGIQPSLCSSPLGEFLSTISAEFNRKAEELNPAEECRRDGESILSSLTLPIFREQKLGAFNFKHARDSAKYAAHATRKTYPPPPSPPSQCVISQADSYIRSWIKIDSFFATWSQDEWGSIYISDLLVWVSLSNLNNKRTNEIFRYDFPDD